MRDRNGAVTERTSGALVVEIRGELDISTVLRWTTLIEAAICELPEPHLLVLDLSSLEFLSARGARGLLEAVESCRERNIGGCVIATPGGVVDRMVRLAGLAEAVRVFPNRLTAIAACQPVQMRWLPG
ncbi:STAS domain-containing protein [Amycolatopsis sp. OK19-0408]|uniref:STAS domain-containing protein n=1 Tax=Amycolatopsis iheyensis TaxID=2945988 RepID=A0A9X2SMV5_9PSEU|nr:STAS domain-containing protein [Amycolatopsis iheyensis]MCR6488019.1 STAS domain-containing protein [Amycolatopsis iheyensis]